MAKTDLLNISFDDDSGLYHVNMPQGSTLNETLFAVSVLIKCLVKDKIIEDYKVAINTIEKYCTDSQFEEVKEVEENGKTKEE